MSGRLKLTLTDYQVEELLLEAEANMREGGDYAYRIAWAAIARQCRSALAYASERPKSAHTKGPVR